MKKKEKGKNETKKKKKSRRKIREVKAIAEKEGGKANPRNTTRVEHFWDRKKRMFFQAIGQNMGRPEQEALSRGCKGASAMIG